MKKVLSIVTVIVLLLSLCACDLLKDVIDSANNEVVQAKTFEFDGISLELTTDFLRMEFISDEYDFIVGDEVLAVMGIKMTFDETDLGGLTVQEFAETFYALMEESDLTPLADIGGIPTFQYRVVDEEEDQTMAVMFYKADDCFWLVMFGADTTAFEGVYADICKYAKSVKCS